MVGRIYAFYDLSVSAEEWEVCIILPTLLLCLIGEAYSQQHYEAMRLIPTLDEAIQILKEEGYIDAEYVNNIRLFYLKDVTLE
jgi:hypothetical protein